MLRHKAQPHGYTGGVSGGASTRAGRKTYAAPPQDVPALGLGTDAKATARAAKAR